MYSPRVPENKVTRIHAGLDPLAAAVLEPLELLVCPVEKISFVPTTLGAASVSITVSILDIRLSTYSFVLLEVLLKQRGGAGHNGETTIFRTIR